MALKYLMKGWIANGYFSKSIVVKKKAIVSRESIGRFKLTLRLLKKQK